MDGCPAKRKSPSILCQDGIGFIGFETEETIKDETLK
jgi:hypothetical protein